MGWEYFKREAEKLMLAEISVFSVPQGSAEKGGMATGSRPASSLSPRDIDTVQTSGMCKNPFAQFPETLIIISYSLDACLP
jgi:hypothetical protein